MAILNEIFITPATPGQQKLFEVRNYRPEEYVENINQYPLFYAQLREKYLANRADIIDQISQALDKFDGIYPLDNSKVYLGIGNFRTNGTTVDSMVLLGAEFVFTDSTTVLDEFSERFDFFRNYIRTNPMKNIDFLAVHEFVHTQQVESIGSPLLSTALREGCAEFIAELLMEKPSTTPAISYGIDNHGRVMQQFKKEMFNTNYTYWLGSNMENQFGLRDLGYYVGYAITQAFYQQSEDKKAAIATIIELDYADTAKVEAFIDGISYFDETVVALKQAYADEQPSVTHVNQEDDKFIVHFSQPMNGKTRGFDYGPLGEEHVLRIREVVGYNPDFTSFIFRANVDETKTQQMTISSSFVGQNGLNLLPYVYTIHE